MWRLESQSLMEWRARLYSRTNFHLKIGTGSDLPTRTCGRDRGAEILRQTCGWLLRKVRVGTSNSSRACSEMKPRGAQQVFDDLVRLNAAAHWGGQESQDQQLSVFTWMLVLLLAIMQRYDVGTAQWLHRQVVPQLIHFTSLKKFQTLWKPRISSHWRDRDDWDAAFRRVWAASENILGFNSFFAFLRMERRLVAKGWATNFVEIFELSAWSSTTTCPSDLHKTAPSSTLPSKAYAWSVLAIGCDSLGGHHTINCFHGHFSTIIHLSTQALPDIGKEM